MVHNSWGLQRVVAPPRAGEACDWKRRWWRECWLQQEY
jgi:hypothetical protein